MVSLCERDLVQDGVETSAGDSLTASNGAGSEPTLGVHNVRSAPGGLRTVRVYERPQNGGQASIAGPRPAWHKLGLRALQTRELAVLHPHPRLHHTFVAECALDAGIDVSWWGWLLRRPPDGEEFEVWQL